MADEPKFSVHKAVAVLWIVGFCFVFYTSNLGNNPSLSRNLFWLDAIGNLPALLNPFDVSHAAATNVDSGWHLLPQRWPFIRTAALVLLSSLVIGTTITHSLLRTSGVTRCERFVIEAGLGLSLQSLWTLIAGAAGHLTISALFAPGGLCAAATVVFIGINRARETSFTDLSDSLPDDAPASRRIWLLAGFTALPFAILLLLDGMTPPFDFDVCEYHMQGPKEWFQAGRISFLEHNVYTSFPFLSEMLILDSMVLADDWNDGSLSGKLVLACFQLLTTICVYATARRWFGTTPALIAGLVYLTVPWTLRISLIAYAEGAITFYLMSTVMCASIVVNLSSDSRTRPLIFVTGLLAGSAMASKYPGVLSVVIPVGLYLLWSARSNVQRWLPIAAVFSTGVLLTVGPWLIRNIHDTGNPVYPLLYGVFGAEDWSPEMDAKWKRAHSAPNHTVTEIPGHVMSILVYSDWTSGLLFCLAAPTLLMLRRCVQARWLWAMVLWMLVTWWALTHRIDRFWIPIIPVVAVLAGASWKLFKDRFWHVLISVSLVFGCLVNLETWRSWTGIVGLQAGLTDMNEVRKLAVPPVFQQINRRLTKNDRILIIGEAAVFHLQIPFFYNTVFDESLFEQWTADDSDDRKWSSERKMKDPTAVRQELKDRGITHVLINWGEILRYRGPGNYTYTDYVSPARFQQLVDAEVLSEPEILGRQEWDQLSGTQRRTIMGGPDQKGWPGHEDLLSIETFGKAKIWEPLRLYRVR